MFLAFKDNLVYSGGNDAMRQNIDYFFSISLGAMAGYSTKHFHLAGKLYSWNTL